MLTSDKSIDRIKSLMHVIESGNKALIHRMDKTNKTFQSPKDRPYASPDNFRTKTLNNSNKLKSVSSSNFFNIHSIIRPESTKNSNEMRPLNTWTEVPKTTNTGAETSDRRVSNESSKNGNYNTPNKEFEKNWGNLLIENSGLKRKIEEISFENKSILRENGSLKKKMKDFEEKLENMQKNEKEMENSKVKMKEMYESLEEKHNERKKHMKQLIEIISEKEKQLEKAKNLHFQIINKKFREEKMEEISQNIEINHQKIIEYALFLENQLEVSEQKITSLLKENEDFKGKIAGLKQDLVLFKEKEQENEMNSMIGNINNELKVIFENLKGIESKKLVNENQYNNEFQNLEESEKKEIKKSIEDLEEQKQRLFNYLRGFFDFI